MVVLENKSGITSEAELAREEERRTKKKALDLYDQGVLDSMIPGTFAALSEIHQFLFEDVYPFAGQIRTVNLAKGSFRFAPLIYLNAALISIEKMPQSTFDEIVEKYVEMNVAHPFREGNGRAMRIWLDQMLRHGLKQVIDWSRVSKEDFSFAMERSPIRDLEIKTLLRNALTDQIDDRELYMKGIDRSYAYEGYTSFKTSELESED